MPAWLLKAMAVALAGMGLAGFSSYVLGHVKPHGAPLHPKVVAEVATELVPPPAAPAGGSADPAEPAPAPTPVVVIKVITVQAPSSSASSGSNQPTVSLSGWLNQTNVPQATTTYAS